MNILWFLSFQANHSCPFATFFANTSALFLVVPIIKLKYLLRQVIEIVETHESNLDPLPLMGMMAVLKRYLKTVFSGSCATASITSAPSTICDVRVRDTMGIQRNTQNEGQKW